MSVIGHRAEVSRKRMKDRLGSQEQQEPETAFVVVPLFSIPPVSHDPRDPSSMVFALLVPHCWLHLETELLPREP